MKKIIVAILLISVLTLSVACNTVEVGVDIGYNESDVEKIFGDLGVEEINDIISQISDRVSEEDEYESDKKDSIIEDVFKENGIEDENRINAAKSKITISKTKISK